MEYLDLVDETGEPTGRTVSRTEAHRAGLRHRTSHVWILRRRGGAVELLLQKRSAEKDSYPGCYDISSAGHIPAGQRFVDSALRELREELGVEAAPEELLYLGQRQFRFEACFHGEVFRDNQVSNVYALWLDRPAESFCVQREEIESVRWMPLADCVQMAATGTPANCVWMEELEMIAAWLAAEKKA